MLRMYERRCDSDERLTVDVAESDEPVETAHDETRQSMSVEQSSTFLREQQLNSANVDSLEQFNRLEIDVCLSTKESTTSNGMSRTVYTVHFMTPLHVCHSPFGKTLQSVPRRPNGEGRVGAGLAPV